ncbi:MAG: diaminopimelate epimerase [Proteobacteria bacterium]|nr:diaminopimelate epimerase [Pseudomonadota bacterium]
MSALLYFSKMHGLGNDFVLLDGISQSLPPLSSQTVHALADRHCGIGFDQLLLLTPATQGGDFHYRIYNADGSEVGQCGNGVRCAHAFAIQRGLTSKQQLLFETMTTQIRTQIIGTKCVRAFMPPAQVFAQQQAEGHLFSHLDIGNPHYVCLQGGDISDAEIIRIGEILNKSVAGGVNVGFAKIETDNIQLRVYERGAGLTKACGSGALAAAVAAIGAQQVNNPTTVTMPGGCLSCGTSCSTEGDDSIWLEGEVNHVFDGTLSLSEIGNE